MPFSTFATDDSGAVTVDWTVLAAAIVGLGVATVAAVRTGVISLGGDIETSLSDASVALLSIGANTPSSPLDGYQLLYPWQNDDVLTYWQTETFPSMTDQDLVALYEQYAQIASSGSMPSFMDFSYAMLTEMTARGVATDAHLELFEAARQTYV